MVGTEPGKAERNGLLSRKLLEQLATEFPEVPVYRKELAHSHSHLGFLWQKIGKLTEAIQAFGDALKLQEELQRVFPKIATYRRSLAFNRAALATVLQKNGQPREAEQAYRTSREGWKKLVDNFPQVAEYPSELGFVLNNLGLLLRDRQQSEEARRCLEEAMDHQQIALKVQPGHPVYLQRLRTHQAHLVVLLLQQGDYRAVDQRAEVLSRLLPQRWQESYRAARLLARCADLAEKDDQLSEDERRKTVQGYCDRAVQLLQQAIQAGYKDYAALKTDPYLARLRTHPAFQKLVSSP
jgi:tetratricopeptide (TPR) repeat protein